MSCFSLTLDASWQCCVVALAGNGTTSDRLVEVGTAVWAERDKSRPPYLMMIFCRQALNPPERKNNRRCMALIIQPLIGGPYYKMYTCMSVGREYHSSKLFHLLALMEKGWRSSLGDDIPGLGPGVPGSIFNLGFVFHITLAGFRSWCLHKGGTSIQLFSVGGHECKQEVS